MRSLIYEEFAVDPALRPWILNYWRFAVLDRAPDAPPHTVWPDGCTSIALLRAAGPGPRVFWTGPRVTAMQPPLRPRSEMWGLRLWPDCSESVLGRSAPSLRDRMGLADPHIAGWAEPLVAAAADGDAPAVIAAFDAMLRPRCPSWPTPDAVIRRALLHIAARKGNVAMAEVAREAGVGLRQLQRRFPAVTGLTLREWARVRRLRESIALRLHDAPAWSAIAAESGFADHAHLAREYRELVGLAPTRVGNLLDTMEHRNVNP